MPLPSGVGSGLERLCPAWSRLPRGREGDRSLSQNRHRRTLSEWPAIPAQHVPLGTHPRERGSEGKTGI